jgi:hypothetical protein
MARSKNLEETLYTVVQDHRFDEGDMAAAKLMEVAEIENESQKTAVEEAGGLLHTDRKAAERAASKVLGRNVEGRFEKVTLRRVRVRVFVPAAVVHA